MESDFSRRCDEHAARVVASLPETVTRRLRLLLAGPERRNHAFMVGVEELTQMERDELAVDVLGQEARERLRAIVSALPDEVVDGGERRRGGRR